MSWTAFHSRGETLRAVVDAANAHQDGILPMQVPGVTEHFTDEVDLLGALLLKWHAWLSGNVERALTTQPLDLETAVAEAWRTTCGQLPGVRLVIDQCTQWPETAEMAEATARAQEREWAWLALAAGLANDESASAIEAGRRVQARARRALVGDLELTAEPTTAIKTVHHAKAKEMPMFTSSKKHKARKDGARTSETTTAPTATVQTKTAQTTNAQSASESFVDRIKAALAA